MFYKKNKSTHLRHHHNNYIIVMMPKSSKIYCFFNVIFETETLRVTANYNKLVDKTLTGILGHVSQKEQ